MYMRKLAAELMHMSRLETWVMVSTAGLASQSSSTPQKKPSLMSKTGYANNGPRLGEYLHPEIEDGITKTLEFMILHQRSFIG